LQEGAVRLIHRLKILPFILYKRAVWSIALVMFQIPLKSINFNKSDVLVIKSLLYKYGTIIVCKKKSKEEILQCLVGLLKILAHQGNNSH